MLRDQSDKTFEKIGQEIPYYVLNEKQYRTKHLAGDVKNAFFRSGEEHIQDVLKVIASQFGELKQKKSALDFGCGVGRLMIPLTKEFDKVVGVDVSPAMLAAAKKNCEERDIQNIDFILSDDQLSRVDSTYDLVHSYIVLQHIPLKRGKQIIERLIQTVSPGGVGALHITFARQASFLRKGVNWVRKNCTPFHYLVNVAQKNPWNEPFLQMNNYNLNQIMQLLFSKGIRKISLEATQHGSHSGVMLFFQNTQTPCLF